ncbi:MAG: alpha-rhamnosidase, partial [Verrucomicrobia bacterium]
GIAVNEKPAGGGRDFRDATMIDIAPHLRAEKDNTIALWVETEAGAPSLKPAFIGRVEILLDNGESVIFSTDRSWKCSTQETEGWTAVQADESSWQSAQILGAAGIEPWGDVMLPIDRSLPARMLRKEFELPNNPVRATLYVSGQGLSECEINGQKVSNHVLSPAMSDYTKRVYYVTHDVTAMLQSGANALGVHLGNGRYHAPRSKWYVLAQDYGVPRVLCQLEIEFADGSRQTMVSDGTWRATDEGPIRCNNEYDGETYDARMEQSGWSNTGFDDSKWEAAKVLDAPQGELSAQMIEPIRVTETLKPKSMSEPLPGVFVFDMGQNLVGWCKITMQGSTGQTVRLRHAEVIREDGHLSLANMRSAEVTATYTLKSSEVEIYEPRFTYFGFRYVEVTGFPGKPTLESIEAKVVHDDLKMGGSFECSAPVINRFHQNVHWGLRGNYRSAPTDCPQRDERQAWLGDRAFSSRGETYMFDAAAFYAKWLRDMRDSQKDTGSISDVCPNYWPLYNDNVTWPSTALIIPQALYEQYGDVRVIEEHYTAMVRWIDYMSQFIEDGLIARDTYGDWCVPPEGPYLIFTEDPARKTHPMILASSYFSNNLRLMAQYAKLLGKTKESEIYQQRASAMAEALHKKFFNPKEGYYDNGTQTSCVLMLAFDLVPANERQRVFDHLVKCILEKTDGHIGTGLIGGQWLNRVLTEGGRADLVYGFGTKTTYPSWGYMIENGATTVWELWNGNTANPAMNSGNHVMLVGDFIIWLYEHVAGIRPDPEQPGFKHVLMEPTIAGGLTHASAKHLSPYGEIRSAWKLVDGVFSWSITIPPNSSATLRIPSGDPASLLESNKKIEESTDVQKLDAGDGFVRLKLLAGSYQFSTKAPKTSQ